MRTFLFFLAVFVSSTQAHAGSAKCDSAALDAIEHGDAAVASAIRDKYYTLGEVGALMVKDLAAHQKSITGVISGFAYQRIMLEMQTDQAALEPCMRLASEKMIKPAF